MIKQHIWYLVLSQVQYSAVFQCNRQNGDEYFFERKLRWVNFIVRMQIKKNDFFFA